MYIGCYYKKAGRKKDVLLKKGMSNENGSFQNMYNRSIFSKVLFRKPPHI